MFRRAYLSAVLLVSVPVLPQAISPVNPASTPDSVRMAIPPPVSGLAYATEVGAEVRSNYLSGGFMFTTSYIDNLYPGSGTPIAETTYSILPTLDLDQTSSTRHITVTYSPGFTFYQPTSALNEVDQNGRLTYQVRLSPHSALRLSDGFVDSSTSFNSVANAAGGSVSGSTATIAPGIIAPFAKQLTNAADGEFTLQTGLNTMIGASGTAMLIHYPNPSETQGLYDSSSRGGSGFYDVRLSAGQYLGASYGYSQTLVYPHDAQSEMQGHTISGFYTFYPLRTLSLSAAAGPEYYRVDQTSLPASASWGPSVSASLGWQGIHTSFAAGYSQAVTAGNGLLGAYHSRSGTATARWRMSRTWTSAVSAGYAINKSASPLLLSGSENGHTVSGSATIEHPINRQLSFELGYNRIHQSYSGIPALSANPDADRVTASISWQFMRPMGR